MARMNQNHRVFSTSGPSHPRSQRLSQSKKSTRSMYHGERLPSGDRLARSTPAPGILASGYDGLCPSWAGALPGMLARPETHSVPERGIARTRPRAALALALLRAPGGSQDHFSPVQDRHYSRTDLWRGGFECCRPDIAISCVCLGA
jgi:hypothetical protein